MKKLTLFIFACVILGLELKGQQVGNTSAPPNIIFIFSEQHVKTSTYLAENGRLGISSKLLPIISIITVKL
jgi:hypothetical protein